MPAVAPGITRKPPPGGAWLSAMVTFHRSARLLPPANNPPPATAAVLPDRVTLATVIWAVAVMPTAPPRPADWLPLKELPHRLAVLPANIPPPRQPIPRQEVFSSQPVA